MSKGHGAGDRGRGIAVKPSPLAPRPSPQGIVPQRILVIRLDRIGDVVLSTPVLQALREAYPTAFIAMMVRPLCRELVEGNPYLNEVILYDRDGQHHGIMSSIRFGVGLRRFRFDTALVLHPTNRSHWIPWFADIPVRIGYDRKTGWLLTHRVAHHKQEGKQHEAEYTLELLRVLGITPPRPRPFVPLHPESDRRVAQLLHEHGVQAGLPAPCECGSSGSARQAGETLVAIHPSASDSSKRWMPERFAEVADRFIEARQAQIVLVAGPGDVQHAQAVERSMRHRPINVAGKLSVGELAALLSRCRLLLSNDSGPVHVAAAVGTPVVAIFGRNQPGLGATRWRPLGPQHVVLQKEGKTGFSYITELSVEDVYQAAARFVSQAPTEA